MRKRSIILPAFCLAMGMLFGCVCGCKVTDSGYRDILVADTSEMGEVVDASQEPIAVSMLSEGNYEVTVESSSSLFAVTDAILSVANGQGTLKITVKGTSFQRWMPGEAEDLKNALEHPSESETTMEPVVDENGQLQVELAITALDEELHLAVYNEQKNTVYTRAICVQASSLPLGAFAEGYFTRVEDLELEDGTYRVEANLYGGSGRATIESPLTISVTDGKCLALIVWSSPNYDYMIVDGEKYLTANEKLNMDGNSVFEIPILGFDYRMPVVADTTAMSTPHEISYTIVFDSKTIQKMD